MRIVNFFDAAQSETVPTIGSLVASNLIVYANDAAYEGGEPGGAVDGSIFYSTDLDKVRVYVNGAWASIVTQADIDAILSRLDTAETDIATLQTDLGTLETNAIQKDGSVAMEADLNIGENAVRRVSMITDVDDVDAVDPGNRQLIAGGNPKLSWGNPGELDAHTSKVINVVDPTDPQDAATKAYVDSVAGAGVSVLDDLTDVDTTGVEDGQALVYDADSSTWVPGDAAGGSGTGGKNYFDAESSDFEKGTIGGWLPYADPAFVNYSLVSAGTSTATISDTWWRAQAITLNDEIVTTFVTQMIKFTTPDGDLICEIVNDNAGEPGTTVFASTTRLANDVPSSKGTFTFTFTGAPRLTGNFFVRLRRSVGTGGVTNIYSASGSGLYDTLDSGATWSTSANGLQAILNTTQRSASSNLTLTANTSNPLAGTTDFSFAKSAVNANGEWAGLFTQTIDRSDRGKVFFGSFSYDATAANYASNDLRVEALDLTSGLPLYVGPSDSLLILKGQGKFDFVVYTEATTEQIEFRIRVNSTNATAYTVFFDEFRLGPAASLNTNYRNQASVTLDNQFTGGAIRIVREGDIVTLISTTAPTHASATSRSSSVGLIPAWARPSVPVANITQAGNSIVQQYNVAADGTFSVAYRDWAGTATNSTGSGIVTLSYTVPALPSQVLTTNELGVQTFKVFASDQTPTGTLTSAWNTMVFATLEQNDGGMYNTTTGILTAPRSGVLDASGQIEITYGTATLRTVAVSIFNITQNKRVTGSTLVAGSSSTGRASFSGKLKVNRGDQVAIQSWTNGSTPAFSSSFAGSNFCVAYEPDFTVLGAVRNDEYIEAVASTTGTTTADTEIDVTGASITLTPGTWDIGYDVDVRAENASGSATNILGRVRITNSSNVELPKTKSLFGSVQIPGNMDVYSTASKVTRVSITTTTTYKLRLVCSASAATGSVNVYTGNITGAITGDDADSVLWARRVR